LAKKSKKFEVSDHILVPKHERLSKAKAKELLEEYGVKLNQLPQILQNDPAIEDMEVEVGDIIKITRKSQTAGEAVYYRVVVVG
jgi:DNA-directed RNA polymerase subunit H